MKVVTGVGYVLRIVSQRFFKIYLYEVLSSIAKSS